MRFICCILLFASSYLLKAQQIDSTPMSASTILYNLAPFKQLLSPMEGIATKEYQKELTQELYQSYTFIEMRLYEAPDSGTSYQQLYAFCRFKIEQTGNIVLEEVYCGNKKTQAEIEHFIKLHMRQHKFTWSKETPAAQGDMYYGAQLEYLLVADQIAKEGYLCDHSYSPGYYSEVLVKETCIELFQVNRHHSRSSDHKDDYYLRDVKFSIPLDYWIPEDRHYDYVLQNLFIDFRDSSSPQNKECGNRIKAKIIALMEE